MELETLKPEQFRDRVQKRLEKLGKILAEKEAQRKKQPLGHLRIAQRHGRPQYYQYTEADTPKGRYISQKEIALAHLLAQKDYDTQVIQILKKEIEVLQTYLNQTKRDGDIKTFYENLCPARQALINPITLPDEQYAAQWSNISWIGRPFTEDTPLYTTTRGERVRSKSEVLIADALARHNIPYRYEYPLQLHRTPKSSATITLHPDFLCLNVHTRAEFYWEHFGLMDNPEYSNNAAGKLRLYTENGILAGRNLIITMETQAEPLSTHIIDIIIQEYLA